ncbi:tail fiber protein [Salmonella phage BSP161]|uniref:Tail fiber protein n=1 Tax=Salmonella phage BSP161 TaxID=2053015 RepID=A0A3G1L3B6_9CAUD|nr:tail fiber protein [Salmonella phage BSP161]ATW58399.1 tail fiber protein [Salmonella phage BSP161]
MANKISTVRTYPLNGAVNFTITFEYLARKFVQVTLIGKDRKELVLNQDYRFTTKTQITTSRAWTAADGYQMIEIRRFTSATDRLVDFADGSILRAYDLNISQIQTLHVAEEARDLTADTIGVNNDGHLDARGRKIVNLAFATSDYDAVPLKQVKERESSAWNAVNKANEHANRSNTEANRSRDEADRAKREADRSTQQAGVSTAQAAEAKKQADRSNSEANRAKGYADSMTASVAEAKKQADRSNSEANRARDEANRAAGEVTKAAAEVAKAAAHVETAKGHADRANTEADRSKGEADRAKSEADKLGNMNDLAGTIESIGSNGKDINFKGGVNGNTILAKNSVHAGVQPNTAFFNDNTLRLRNRDHKERAWDIFVWGNDSGRGNVLEFGTNYGKGYGMYLQFANGDSQDSQLQVNGAIAAKTDISGRGITANGELITRSSVLKLINSGRRHIQFMTNDSYTDGYIYKDPGAGVWRLNFGQAANMEYTFASNGHLTSNSGWNIPPDGNLYIKKYNTYIDAWVNNRLSEHAYNKGEVNNLVNGRLTAGQGDGRYVRKNAGWTEVWKGTAGGTVSVGLSQDVRWRTIWIQTQGRWNPVQIGDNGPYYISSMGGWLQFTISNNGRTFRNDADRSSVPTRILVQNQ